MAESKCTYVLYAARRPGEATSQSVTAADKGYYWEIRAARNLKVDEIELSLSLEEGQGYIKLHIKPGDVLRLHKKDKRLEVVELGGKPKTPTERKKAQWKQERFPMGNRGR